MDCPKESSGMRIIDVKKTKTLPFNLAVLNYNKY